MKKCIFLYRQRYLSYLVLLLLLCEKIILLDLDTLEIVTVIN